MHNEKTEGTPYVAWRIMLSHVTGVLSGFSGEEFPGNFCRRSFARGDAEGRIMAVRLSGATSFKRWRPPQPESPPWWLHDTWPIVPAFRDGVPVRRKEVRQ